MDVFDLGIVPYRPAQDLQGRLRLAVAEGSIPGALLLLEHQPVITLGKRGSLEDLRDVPSIRRRGIDIVRSERGGQTTLHAPGQLVSYSIVPIPRHDLRAYVTSLEQVLIRLLSVCGISASRRPAHPGLYVEGLKIASLGLRCHRWVASHGTSLNVNIDLSLFDLIISCGEAQLGQTSIEALGRGPHPMDEIKDSYVGAFREVLGWELTSTRRLAYDRVEGALGLDRPSI